MANAQPIFVAQPRNESIKLSSAADDEDGAGSTELFQAGNTDGSRLHAINALPVGDQSSLNVIRLYLSSSGVKTLIAEAPVPQYTNAQGSPAPNINLLDYTYNPQIDPADRYITLDSGDSLFVALVDTPDNPIHITAWGGDY